MKKTIYYIDATAAELADAVAEVTGKVFVKAMIPERYVCRGVMIEDGKCTINSALSQNDAEKIICALETHGYAPTKTETVDTDKTSPQKLDESKEKSKPVIRLSIPNTLSEDALRVMDSIIHKYSNLIKNATGCESTDIEVTDETITFPWFCEIQDEYDLQAWMVFVSRLCAAVSEMNWVHHKEPMVVENERYWFRALLRQIGMEGAKYKAERVRLMDKLQGDAAFKTPRIRERKRK